jgi:hypothetical protein
MSSTEKSIEQISAEKAVDIINSCEVCDHFDNAESFVELFHQNFNNEDVYKKLLDLIKVKKEEKKCFK